MRKVHHPVQATALARSQGGLISARQCDELGISSDRRTALVRHGVWRRVVRSVYDCQLPTEAGNAFDRRRRRSAWIALLAAGPDAVATGMCALVLHGVWGLPQVIAPEAMLPGVRANRGPVGVRIRRGPRTGRIVRVGSARAVDVRTALIQALPELDRNTAVAVMDSALNRELIDTEGLAWVRRRLRARRGARRLEAWWPLVDGRAESPLETHARWTASTTACRRRSSSSRFGTSMAACSAGATWPGDERTEHGWSPRSTVRTSTPRHRRCTAIGTGRTISRSTRT